MTEIYLCVKTSLFSKHDVTPLQIEKLAYN